MQKISTGLDFLVVSFGSMGDTYPLLAVAIELRRRGHRVRFAGNSRYSMLASRFGIDFVSHEKPLSVSARPITSRKLRKFRELATYSFAYQSLSRYQRRKRSYLAAMKWLYELIVRQPEPQRTIVIAHANAFGARLAQEALHVPLVTVQLQPLSFRSIYDSPGLPLPTIAGKRLRALTWYLSDALFDLIITPEFNQYRATLGLEAVRRPLRKWIYSPDLVMGLFPDWFGPPQPDWPSNTHLLGFPLFDQEFATLPAECEQFLSDGEPPIVFTRGSHSRSHEAYSFFETSIETARLLNRRALLLARERDWIPQNVPPSVRYFGFVPLSKILSRAAAIVHHGGIGTTAHALAAGIPQIVVPLFDDQPDNAARIERLGAGSRLSPREYSAAKAAKKLQTLLNSQDVAATCRRLAASMASHNTIDAACHLIEDWAERSGFQYP